MNENPGRNGGPEIRRRVFRANRWTGSDPIESGAARTGADRTSTGSISAGSTRTARDGAGGAGVDSAVFVALPKAAVEAFAGRDDAAPRHVVHLVVAARDLPGAADLACALVRSLDFLPELDAGETTVSEEDTQGVRHRVFCDRLLPDRRRCALRHAHAERCSPTSPA